MGQENEKVSITHIDNPQPLRSKSRRIFFSKAPQTQISTASKCDRHHCECPNPHGEIPNLKLCTNCDSKNMPPLRKNNKLPYQADTGSRINRTNITKDWRYEGEYTENQKILDKSEPLYYYNGWGLPMQKCYIDPSENEFNETNPPINLSEPASQSEYSDHKPPSPPFIPPKYEYYEHEQFNNIPPPFESIPKPEPPKISAIDLDNIDIKNRVQNLFMF